uniref:Uncharacterized protein n=1 Tax=Acrobeloides nanus TaxID=290746 RepID=A0A914CFA2_9BILA
MADDEVLVNGHLDGEENDEFHDAAEDVNLVKKNISQEAPSGDLENGVDNDEPVDEDRTEDQVSGVFIFSFFMQHFSIEIYHSREFSQVSEFFAH